MQEVVRCWWFQPVTSVAFAPVHHLLWHLPAFSLSALIGRMTQRLTHHGKCSPEWLTNSWNSIEWPFLLYIICCDIYQHSHSVLWLVGWLLKTDLSWQMFSWVADEQLEFRLMLQGQGLQKYEAQEEEPICPMLNATKVSETTPWLHTQGSSDVPLRG